jgi:iron complex outermembrane receptor protein
VQFSEQAQMQITSSSDQVKDFNTDGIVGRYKVSIALKTLLQRSGLSYKPIGQSAISIGKFSGDSGQSTTQNASSGSSDDANSTSGGGKKISQDFRVAQVDQGKSSSASSVGNQAWNAQDNSNNPSTGLSEIIVTAQKKSERLQDVPVPVTALSGQLLVDNNLVRLQDYYAQVPGLAVTPDDFNGAARLTIRGITSGGYSNPTVGITVDDIPYGSSTNIGGGYQAPDIDPGDLSRVEVLRGPQGTLYGASSMGGLVKFVTTDPSMDGVSGRVQAGTSSVYNGAELGYNVRASVNVPLSDTVAMRASGFARQDPGYIDDPGLQEKGVNWGEAYGGRLSVLWRPSQSFSLKLSALFQDTTVHGAPFVDVGLGDLQQSNTLRESGGYTKKEGVYSAILTGKLGAIDVTALTGYNANTYSNLYDYSWFFAPYSQSQFGTPGTLWSFQYKTDKITQEIRLSAPIGQKIDWLFGLFYDHENSSPGAGGITAVNPATGETAGVWSNGSSWNTFQEYAAFTDLTFHFTDRFDLQVGGRESQNRQTNSAMQSGPEDVLFGLPFTYVQPEAISKDNSFTYLVTPKLKISPDLMVYARLASGYRPGGTNFVLSSTEPTSYKSDKTQNYEIGVKGDVFDRALSFDVSLYHIDWKDIQIQVVDPTNQNGYTANGSRAKSQGVELSLESRPLTGLTIAGWVAWDDAVLTEPFPPISVAHGIPGDRLPYSARFSGNLSLEQSFPLVRGANGFVGASVSYVGDREDVFTGGSPRQDLPAYSQTDVRAGVRCDSWSVNFFVTNLADKRGLLTGGLGTINPSAFNYIQPRTAGFNLVKSF